MSAGNREVKAKSWTTTAILTLVEPLIRRLIRRALVGGLGGDAIDHGALSGLNDDDHAQYLLDDAGAGGAGIDVISRIIAINVTELLTLFDHDDLVGLADDDHLQYLLDVAATGGDGINVVSRIVSVDLDANPGLVATAAGLILSLITLVSESTVDPANDQIAFMDNSASDVPRRTDIQNMYDAAANKSVVTRNLAYLAWRDLL